VSISAKDKLAVSFYDSQKLMSQIYSGWLPPEYMRMSEIEYAEKNVRVATESVPPLIIPFTRNPVQLVYHEMKNNIPIPRSGGKRILTLKSRRMGITTYEQAISYSMCRTQRGAQCITVAQSADAALDIFKMVKRMNDDDPNYMKTSVDKKDGLEYKKLRSSFSITTAGGTSIKRGATLQRAHGTEVAFWDLKEQSALNLLSSIDKATNCGEFVLETTANGVGGAFYDRWQEASSGESRWNQIFLGWYLDSRNSVIPYEGEAEIILDTLTDEEVFLFEKFGCNINQLAWRRDQIKGGPKEEKQFKQEYPATPEEAFISTGSSYFATDVIERKERGCKTPIRESEGLCIWAEPIEGVRYIVAADTSEGNLNSDDSPIGVLRWDNGEQVARLNWKASPSALGHKCVEFAKKYNGALIAIENNNTGHSAINTVMNQCLYNRVYYHEDLVKENPKESTTPGWRTTGLTRPLLLNELNDSLENDEMIVNDKLFLTQCRVFRDNGQGKLEASRNSGHHGDLVITWGIAWQARKAKWQLSLEPIFV